MSPIPLGILAASGAGAATAFEHLSTTILGSAASTVTLDLSGFPEYEYFHVRIVSRATTTGTNPFNVNVLSTPSTGTYHSRRYWLNTDSTSGAGYGFGQALVPSNTSSNVSTYRTRMMFDWYPGSPTKRPILEGFAGRSSNDGLSVPYRVAGYKAVTQRDTGLTISCAQNFEADSRFSVYGWRIS
jgi:hypothetical protein